MSITWIFAPLTQSSNRPAICGQFEKQSYGTLTLRNPWIPDSVFMGKIYTASILFIIITFYPPLFVNQPWNTPPFSSFLLAAKILGPLLFVPFLIYRIWLIKALSNFYFNRLTQKIHYTYRGKLTTLEWSQTVGGVYKITEIINGSYTTSHALALAVPRPDGTLHKKDCLWVDSNEPSDPSITYVAEVWEYLRQFMAHGPDQLPAPGEPNWWHVPLNAICLTPAQAWRHYAPWRTGEPGEMQGKKLWLLPMWAVLFPYNLSVAVFWYAICRMFNIKAAPAPPEAFEAAPEGNNEIDINAALTRRGPRRKKADKQRV
ncbi:hypothetical protein [Pseudomonas farsensis]|uniref:hypothetical protein n=1 Tax=Pseudomonas farsensis TaxID=2745492 RepID=UPI001CEC3D54|nr:hypothetical protein [Pseudomonas farsensis]